jgi:predicted dienelactone hydrolase
VGVHGTSAGAITAMTLVGAEWSLRDLIRHCLAVGEADLGFYYNGLPDEAARAARRARFESARNVPDFMLGQENNARHGGRDPRIVVVAVSIPVGAIFRADSLAQVAVPVGVVRAEADRLTPNAFHADRLLRHCSACTPLAMMAGAGAYGRHVDLAQQRRECGSGAAPGGRQARTGLRSRGARGGADGDRSVFRASPRAMRLRTWLPPGAVRDLGRRLLLAVALARPPPSWRRKCYRAPRAMARR